MKKKLCFFVFIIFTFVFPTFSQSKINKNGWKFPQIKSVKLVKETVKIIDEVSVTGKRFEFTDQKPLILLRTEKKQTSKSTYYCEFRYLTSYSVENNLFAHQFNCVPFVVIIENSKSKREIIKTVQKNYVGAIISTFYLDENGDGKFETKSNSWKMPALPGWVKNQQ